MFISSAVRFIDFLFVIVSNNMAKFMGILSRFSDLGNYRKIADQLKFLIFTGVSHLKNKVHFVIVHSLNAL